MLVIPGTKPAKPAPDPDRGEKRVLQQPRTQTALWRMSANPVTRDRVTRRLHPTKAECHIKGAPGDCRELRRALQRHLQDQGPEDPCLQLRAIFTTVKKQLVHQMKR